MDKVLTTLPWAPLWISILSTTLGSMMGYYFFKRWFYIKEGREYQEVFEKPVLLKTTMAVAGLGGAGIGILIMILELRLTYRVLLILVPSTFYLGIFVPMISKKLRERLIIIRDKELVEMMHDVPEAKVTVENSIENINQLIQKGKSLRARFELMTLAKRDIKEIGKLIKIANLYLDLGRIKEGKEFLLSKKKDFEKSYLYYRHLAFFCLESGKEGEALEYAKEAEATEKNPNSSLLLGYVYWTLHDLNNAITHTENALKLNPTGELLVTAKNNLAYYYAQANITEKKDLALTYADFDSENWHRYRWSDSYSLNSAYVKMRFSEELDEIQKAIRLLQGFLTKPDIKEEAKEYLKEAYEKETKIKEKVGKSERGSGFGRK